MVTQALAFQNNFFKNLERSRSRLCVLERIERQKDSKTELTQSIYLSNVNTAIFMAIKDFANSPLLNEYQEMFYF
jgi:hypothetical protein